MKFTTREETFVLIKPDVLERALFGRIFQKFEDADLKIEAIKTVKSTKELAYKHYLYDRIHIKTVGKKALFEFEKENLNAKKLLGTENPEIIGARILKWSREYITKVKVIACILSGPHAIERVKQIVGITNPFEAERGTIRGDFCSDSVINSNLESRAIYNLVHRSSNISDAIMEIEIWFG